MRRATLGNGLRICTIEHHEVPLITCFVLMPIGSSQDPQHQPGLAAITGDLLDEGSGDLEALAVHEALGRIGAHLDTEIGADATLLELTTLEQYAPRALELLASMVRNPRLDQRDFDRVRELRLNRLMQLRDLPPAVADQSPGRCTFGPETSARTKAMGRTRSGRMKAVSQLRGDTG